MKNNVTSLIQYRVVNVRYEMKKFMLCIVLVAMLLESFGAVVERMVVRQQWPWFDDVKIEYLLTGVDSPVDVELSAESGEKRLNLSDNHIRGKCRLIDKDGIYTLTINARDIAENNPGVSLKNVKFGLSAVPATERSKEVIYKIFDLQNRSVTDVTRGELLNGDYGSVETDYSKIGEGYSTPLSDVLIWTGVTNYPGAKTTKLVMRKIPAGGFRYPQDGVWGNAEYSITVSKPYYIGVFELTQRQYEFFCNTNNNSLSYMNPAELACNVADDKPLQNFTVKKVIYDDVRTWDSSTGAMKILKDLFSDSGSYYFDLPTRAMWYRAMRAESTTYYYDGIEGAPSNFDADERIARLGRFAGTGGIGVDGNGVVVTNGTASVGSYRPNAFGLYDMIGNVMECTRDYGHHFSSDSTDPISSTSASSNAFGIYGNAWDRNACLWPQESFNMNIHAGSSKRSYIGVRLSFFEDGHPNKTNEE